MPDNPTTQAARRYYWQFGVAIALYMIVLIASIELVERLGLTGAAKIALLLLPVVPVGLVFAACVRFYQRTDELTRAIAGESLALSAGLTALLAVTYGFLESAGLPKLSAWWTYVTIMALWLIICRFVARRYR